MTSDFLARSRQFQDALDEALAESDETADRAGVLDTLARLVERSRAVAGDHPHVVEALDALDSIAGSPDVEAALSEAAALFESPQRFRESLFFARCLDRDAATSLELMKSRGYVAGAVVPVATYPDLATDQAALLEATTFAQLWQEPSRHRAILDRSEEHTSE